MKKTDIASVASVAGVSTTTVSRVINGVSTVSDDNRRRVNEAIKKLKYRPNRSAQRLASGKMRTVGLIIPRYEGIFRSYYALQVLKGIGMASENHNCDLLLHITDGKSLPGNVSVDGLLFVDIYGCEDLVDDAFNQNIPCVVLNHYMEELPVNCVAVDNRMAAERVVDYFNRLGHKDIAAITGDLKVQAGLQRFDGFVQAMKARNLPIRDAYVRFTDFGLPSARAASEALLSLPDRPTAIFVASDEMALETINVALAKGIRVPEELSIIGFDDNPIAAHGRVPLTTIKQPLDEMGKMALDILLQQISGKRHSPAKILLPTELIERSSTRQTWLER